jgi:hypothetical protein
MPRYLCAAHQYWTVLAAFGPTHEHDGQVCWSLSFCTLRGTVVTREALMAAAAA